jgi:ankyrin repeat protein
LKLIVDAGVDINEVNSNGFTGIYDACQNGFIDIVKYLIAKGADINIKLKDGATCFHIACQEGHYEVVNYLRKKGMDITQETIYGSTGFKLACAFNCTEIIELLTDKLNRVCIVCNKPSRNRCTRCDMRYCSSECQNIDWKQHKKICKKKK